METFTFWKPTRHPMNGTDKKIFPLRYKFPSLQLPETEISDRTRLLIKNQLDLSQPIQTRTDFRSVPKENKPLLPEIYLSRGEVELWLPQQQKNKPQTRTVANTSTITQRSRARAGYARAQSCKTSILIHSSF